MNEEQKKGDIQNVDSSMYSSEDLKLHPTRRIKVFDNGVLIARIDIQNDVIIVTPNRDNITFDYQGIAYPLTETVKLFECPHCGGEITEGRVVDHIAHCKGL